MHELPSLKKMFVAQTTMHILCAGAVVAAGWEVWNDLKPGGHHGDGPSLSMRSTSSWRRRTGIPKHHKALHSATLKFVIAGGALACAVAELVEDWCLARITASLYWRRRTSGRRLVDFRARAKARS